MRLRRQPENGGAAVVASAERVPRVRSYASPADVKLPVPRAHMTAAATRVRRAEASSLKRLSQPWQRRALQYYEMTPEAHFVATYQGNMVSQVRFYIAKINGTEKEEVDDVAVTDYLTRIHDPGTPERTELQRQFGRLMLLTGEGYLLATGTGDDDQPEKWEFLSNEELRVDADGRLRRFAAPGGSGVVFEQPEDEEDAFEPLDDGQAVAYRMWRPSPKHSRLADSPMMGVLDLFEELLLLQMAVRARVRSRLTAAGLLILDDSITAHLPPDARADHRNPQEDPLLAGMIQHMMRPIGDPDTASAVVPYMLRVALEEGRKISDLVHHVRFSDPNETYRETGLRKECIERIATGMDFPAEILTGTGDMNHWNAWQVDEQVAKTLIFPVCELFCSNLTDSYLRPAMRDGGVTDWQDYIVWYDPAAIITRPDKSADARELYDRGELMGDGLRDAHGWKGTEDKPKDPEVIRWMALQKKDPQMFLTGEPTPEPVLGPDGQPVEPGEGQEGPVMDEETDKTRPPEPVLAAGTQPDTLVGQARVALILGASEMALERARELAGSRVRTRTALCQECFEGTEDVPNRALVAALGPEKLQQIEAPPPAELVAGAGRPLQATLSRLGLTDEWAARLAEEVEGFAARALMDPDMGLPPEYENLVMRTRA